MRPFYLFPSGLPRSSLKQRLIVRLRFGSGHIRQMPSEKHRPFSSKAQWRLCFAQVARGERTEAGCRESARKSDFASLPEYVDHRPKPSKTRRRRKTRSKTTRARRKTPNARRKQRKARRTSLKRAARSRTRKTSRHRSASSTKILRVAGKEYRVYRGGFVRGLRQGKWKVLKYRGLPPRVIQAARRMRR